MTDTNNLVIESNVNSKEAQTLARHTTAELTIGLYGRAADQRLVQAIDQIAQRVICMASAGEGQAQLIEISEEKGIPKGGFEPPTLRQRPQHQRHTDPTLPSHFNALPVESQNLLTPESHPIHSSVRESCAPSVPENSASLIAIIEARDCLSPEVRNQLVVILRHSRKR